MFFTLSKLFWLIVNPLNAIFLIMALGALLRLKWKRAGGWIISLGITAFLIFGFLPIGDNMLIYLERQYERPTELPERIDGIIMLGGAVSNSLSAHHGYTITNGLAERLHDFAALSRRYPNAIMVFTGGSGDPSAQHLKEATYIRKFWNDMGLDDDRLITEDQSQNTYQNAIYSHGLVKPQREETWLLITSAYHMPRSIAIFDHIGWNVIAYPTDHRTKGKHYFLPKTLRVSGQFGSLQTALKEYIGTAIYYLTGKSSLLFPHKIVRS